jgi:FAD/FMN-containing dehydrogenase
VASEAPADPPGWRVAPQVPEVFPSGVMNRHTVRAMNATWYAKHGANPRRHYVGPEAFYYQLDMATEWNRGYGKRGFTQYQCVMPSDLGAYTEFIERFQSLGGCSFVTVFKDCGPAGPGMLSFPQEGTSLALDIPIGPDTQRLVDELNAFVVEHGGRIYLAKDAFTSKEHFRAMYPRLEEFLEVKRRYDPDNRFSSVMAERLGILG